MTDVLDKTGEITQNCLGRNFKILLGAHNTNLAIIEITKHKPPPSSSPATIQLYFFNHEV
jgi:hypothetical protein